MKTIAVVGTVGIPSCYGGFESLVENLTLYKSVDYKYSVFCSGKVYKNKIKEHNGAELIYLPLSANGLNSVFYDILSLIKCIFMKPDTVLILGVSGCIFLPVFRMLSGAKIITNIDGMEWKREKWSFWSKKFLKFSERLAVKFSHAVVTDNQAISDYVREEYNINSVTIAYGGDHALQEMELINPGTDALRYSLAICRIEPENNIAMILHSFSLSGERIKFIGNWNASQYGRSLRERYGEFSNIELINPIYNLNDLYKLRRNCSAYIHGHSAGGTNPSLVEIMHFSVPVFAFDCVFNKYTTDGKAHYFDTSERLSSLLKDTTSDDLQSNAKNMQIIAEEKYTWSAVTKFYESLY